jgi:uncharacterized protein YdhG (YjbR/CyaY superfamily)
MQVALWKTIQAPLQGRLAGRGLIVARDGPDARTAIKWGNLAGPLTQLTPGARHYSFVKEANEMASKRPTTISEYIQAAPLEGQPHLQQLYAILKSVAPEAEEAIKWGTPFFVEPRFLFAFSAHKAHLNFSPTAATLEPFQEDLEDYKITSSGLLQIPYNKPLPEDLIRKIAEYRLREVRERLDDAFW